MPRKEQTPKKKTPKKKTKEKSTKKSEAPKMDDGTAVPTVIHLVVGFI